MGELYPLQGSNTAEETGKDGVDERAGEGCRARAGTKSSNGEPQWLNPPRVSKQSLEQLQLLQRGTGPFPWFLAPNPSLPASTGARNSSTIPACAHKGALPHSCLSPSLPSNAAQVCSVSSERLGQTPR